MLIVVCLVGLIVGYMAACGVEHAAHVYRNHLHKEAIAREVRADKH